MGERSAFTLTKRTCYVKCVTLHVKEARNCCAVFVLRLDMLGLTCACWRASGYTQRQALTNRQIVQIQRYNHNPLKLEQSGWLRCRRMENYQETGWSAMSQFESDLDALEAVYAEQFGEEKPSAQNEGKKLSVRCPLSD